MGVGRHWGLLPILAPGVFTASFVAAALLTPDYSHVSQTVSIMASPHAPYPWILATGFALYGVFVLPLGVSLRAWLAQRGRSRAGALVLVLMTLYGMSGILAAILPTDPSGVVTPTGVAHDVIARVGFGGIWCTTALTAFLAWALPDERKVALISAASAVSTAGLALAFQSGLWEGVEGALQRGFFATTIAWVQAISIVLRPRSEQHAI